MAIMCPYCLSMQEPKETGICSKCDHRLPKRYLNAPFKGKPICLGTYGLPSHGKTAFVSNLILTVGSLYKVVPGAILQPLDDATTKTINVWKSNEKLGNTALGSTKLPLENEVPVPLILQLSHFPHEQSHILVTYDLAGEVVYKSGNQPQFARALNNVETIWFVISLFDLLKNPENGYSMEDLFTIYQQTMENLSIPIKGKNILVVYTKADKLMMTIEDSELPSLPVEVCNYLYDDHDEYEYIKEWNPDKLNRLEIDTYIQKMFEISNSLADFTSNAIPGGGAFLAMAEAYETKVLFTMNSAYGEEPEHNGKLARKTHPMRILDALIWTTILENQGSSSHEVALIVPSKMDAISGFSQDIIMRVYNAFTSNGANVATYYSGKIEPAFAIGTAPKLMQQVQLPHLIGPILDHLKPETMVVLFIDNKFPLDLADFAFSSWMERLLVVAPRKEMLAAWLPHSAILQQDSDVEQIVSSFQKKIATRLKGK